MNDPRIAITGSLMKIRIDGLDDGVSVKAALTVAMAEGIDQNFMAAPAPHVLAMACELVKRWLVELDRSDEADQLDFETRCLFALQRGFSVGNMAELLSMEDEIDESRESKREPFGIHALWMEACETKGRSPEDLRKL